jgi:hypothetical protein
LVQVKAVWEAVPTVVLLNTWTSAMTGAVPGVKPRASFQDEPFQ